MKIFIIGSTQYERMMDEHAWRLIREGHEVRSPILDANDHTPLELMQANLKCIKWAEEVHLFWDCRSPGAWGDFCMAFALGKKVVAVYLEEKLMRDVVREYGDVTYR